MTWNAGRSRTGTTDGEVVLAVVERQRRDKTRAGKVLVTSALRH